MNTERKCLAKVAKNAKKTNTILLGVLGDLGETRFLKESDDTP